MQMDNMDGDATADAFRRHCPQAILVFCSVFSCKTKAISVLQKYRMIILGNCFWRMEHTGPQKRMSNGERETEARTVMEALGYKTSRLLLYCRLSSMFSMFAALIPSVVTAWLICVLFSRQKIMIFGQELPVQMLQGALWWRFIIPLILFVLEMLLQQILMIRRNNIYYGREIAERLQG